MEGGIGSAQDAVLMLFVVLPAAFKTKNTRINFR